MKEKKCKNLAKIREFLQRLCSEIKIIEEIYTKSIGDKRLLFNILGLSTLVLLIFLIKIALNGFWIWGGELAFAETGQFGDFIGGVIGTIFSGAGFYFLYVTLVEQRKAGESQKDAFEKERFEAKFYDLIKLYRDNVTEQSYIKYGNGKFETSSGRKVFRVIHKEFEECYAEVKRFCKITNQYDFILEKQRLKINQIKENNSLRIDEFEFAIIDITFNIVYFGVARDSEAYLSNKFSKKYKSEFYYKLIKFMQLKPKKEKKKHFKVWELFRNENTELNRPIFEEIYINRRNRNYIRIINDVNILENYSLEKYYGGHQHRLGHYYRHLFQSYKFLHGQTTLSDGDKYFYGKTFRAQLSTYEQSLLFINSVSSLGLKWDLEPETDGIGITYKLISTYHLIKNVPGRKLLNISYKKFYPTVKFEFED